MTALMLVVLPIVMNNFLGGFLLKISTKASDSLSQTTGSITSLSYNFTGLAAFFINHMRIADAISVLFSALAIRFTLSLIPGSKV